MSRFFLELFNISITASWLIVAILVIRLLFRRFAPRWAMCVLWALVGVRLLFPFSIESNFSLLPSKEVFITDAVYSDYYNEQDIVADTSDIIVEDENSIGNDDNIIGDVSQIPDNNESFGDEEVNRPQKPKPQYRPNRKPPQYVDTGIGAIDDKINNAITDRLENGETNAENPIKSMANTGGIIWACGASAMLLYAAINYVLLRRKVATAIPDKGRIRRSEAVGSPFILGLMRPKIYLPFGLSADTEMQVIAHERAHIKRHDHLIKPVGYLLLAIYWFNPLIWVAYILLCRDIEMACDEKVVKNMNADARKAYASALLECGVKHSRIAACPLAFGEIGVKQRVKNALNYKKPLFWIIIVSVIICIAVAIFFLTSPMGNNNSATEDTATNDEAADNSNVSNDTSDNSDVLDNSDTSTENPPQELVYSGDVYLKSTTYVAPPVLIHSQPDYSANLPTCLRVLNEGVWMKPNIEINTKQFTYEITVGDKTVYYNVLKNFFYSPETGKIVFATQSDLGINANDIKNELSAALYRYPNPSYPNPDVKETYLKYIENKGFKYDAAGYFIEINVADANAVQAIEMHDYLPIIAVYDGNTTHFYNYETGKLLHSQKGKFLSVACDGGGFMEGDAGTADGDRCVTIEDKAWDFTVEENHWHEVRIVIASHWYTNDQKTAILPYEETVYSYGGYDIASNNRYTACRYAEIYNNINGPVEKVEDVINTATYGKYGVVFNGKTVIPFEFDKVDTLQHRHFCSEELPVGVYRTIKDEKTYYYSTNGTNLTPNGFVCGSQPRDNRALVYDGEKLYIIKFSAKINGAFVYAVNGNTGKITTIESDLSEEVYDIIVGDGWKTGKTDCRYGYTLFFSGDKYYYDPECGTLCDLNGSDASEYGEYFTVSEELRNRINTALSQPDTPTENPNPEPPKTGDLFDGHMYLYTYYTAYRDVNKHDASGTNSDLVRQIMLNANWVDGNKSSEDYHYIIEFGHIRNCEIEYNEDINLLWDKHNGRYAFLDSATALKLSAIMRSPDVKFSGKTKTERFTIVETQLDKVAITDKNFFATDSKGNLVHIVWKDEGRLSEGCVVDVTYDTSFPLEGTMYYYFNDDNGYKTNTGISAYEVKIVSKPKQESLNKTREVDFNATDYVINLKGLYGEKYGINGKSKVITSLEEMQAFLDAYPNTSERGTQDWGYEGMTENLTNGYFRDRTLLMLYASNEYLFTDYTVNKVSVDNGTLTVDYTATAYVGIGPSQVPNNIIMVEVKKSDISDCTKFVFNGTVVKPDSPKTEPPETVDYILHYTPAGAMSSSQDDHKMFSVTSYDVFQDLLENHYTFKEDSPIYDIGEDFFREKALICVRITAGNTTDFDNMGQLLIEDGRLKAKFTYTIEENYEDRSSLLCYFEVDKDLVLSFKRCEFDQNIVH